MGKQRLTRGERKARQAERRAFRSTRVCGFRRYCGAMRAASEPGPLCAYCDAVECMIQLFERGLNEHSRSEVVAALSR